MKNKRIKISSSQGNRETQPKFKELDNWENISRQYVNPPWEDGIYCSLFDAERKSDTKNEFMSTYLNNWSIYSYWKIVLKTTLAWDTTREKMRSHPLMEDWHIGGKYSPIDCRVILNFGFPHSLRGWDLFPLVISETDSEKTLSDNIHQLNLNYWLA